MQTNVPSPALMPRAPRRISRADEVYEQLEQDVYNFKLMPGDRFTKTEISERLVVSRTPVRQALFRLQHVNFVEVLFRIGWRVLPFDINKFDELYDLRMVLETTAVLRLCQNALKVNQAMLDKLIATWLISPEQRSSNMAQVSKWDEAFHCALVAAAGNAEMVRVHSDMTDRIRVIRQLDFTKQPRIDATYEEHSKILKAIYRKRADQADTFLSRPTPGCTSSASRHQ